MALRDLWCQYSCLIDEVVAQSILVPCHRIIIGLNPKALGETSKESPGPETEPLLGKAPAGLLCICFYLGATSGSAQDLYSWICTQEPLLVGFGGPSVVAEMELGQMCVSKCLLCNLFGPRMHFLLDFLWGHSQFYLWGSLLWCLG